MSRLTGCVMAAIWVVKCGWWAESVLVGMYAATGEPILGKGGCDPEFGGQEGCGGRRGWGVGAGAFMRSFLAFIFLHMF